MSDLQAAFEASLGHGHYIDRAFLEAVGLHLNEATYIYDIVRSKHSSLRPSDFLLAFNFMKEYRFEQISALQFNIRSTTTYENVLWSSLAMIDDGLPPVLIPHDTVFILLFRVRLIQY